MKPFLLAVVLATGCQALLDPDKVPLPGPQGLAAGALHTCTCATNSPPTCWGDNSFGQLGIGSTGFHAQPVFTSLSYCLAIAAGDSQTCAIEGGNIRCWGRNDSGQLGNGSTSDQLTPQSNFAFNDGEAQSIAAGERHTCAIGSGNSQISCWGSNSSGQLGNNSTNPQSLVPVTVSGVTFGAQGIAAGRNHTCAIIGSSRAVWCWGSGASGQLGRNSTADSLVPAFAAAFTGDARAIAAGGDHTCVLTNFGKVWCWGDNSSGQLGNGAGGMSLVPVQTQNLPPVVLAITAGWNHTCAIAEGGGVWCWGDNSKFQLGNHDMPNSSTPVSVPGFNSSVQAISAGQFHTCALVNGEIQCWGGNDSGQLGDGTRTSRSTPRPIAR